jgi:hypothetical protein
MIGLILSMVAGVFIGVMALILGVNGGAAVWIGVAGSIVALIAIVYLTAGSVPGAQATLDVQFPAPENAPQGPDA